MSISLALSIATLSFAPAGPLLRSPAAARLAARQPAIEMLYEVDETWTTTASGLQYLDITTGSGETPNEGEIVKVDYTGVLEKDGTQFDSSIGRAPIAFPIGKGRVIPGWDEGISTMKVGSKRILSIPAELGYGEAGAGEIPPNARLQFECELKDIVTGFDGLVESFPGGKPNIILFTLLLISFIPYFLPPDMVPDFWK